jgi:geranylgeranyl diphosphate synthase type 3
MSSLALDSVAQAAPSFIPPRTSSHGVAFASSPPGTSASNKSALAAIDPPVRKSSKRPVSTTSENWLAQSSEKKAVTLDKIEPSSRPRGHSHSHRPKSAHAGDRTAGTVVKFGSRSVLPMAPGEPPREPPKDFGDDLIYAKRAPWSKEKEKILVGPFDYLYGHPGKDIRSQCIAAFNEWLKVPEERLAVITRVIGMLHTSSLLLVTNHPC